MNIREFDILGLNIESKCNKIFENNAKIIIFILIIIDYLNVHYVILKIKKKKFEINEKIFELIEYSFQLELNVKQIIIYIIMVISV